MKNIVFFFAFVFASLFFVQRSDAQCYVRLEDASGFNTDAYQDSLQAAAAKLCAIFDTTGFEGQFKVYDFGFYLHQEKTTGGYPEPFAQKIAEVQALSPYYLLFGKQTDKTGVYTKFWVDLVLPDTGEFECILQSTPNFQEALKERLKYDFEVINNPSSYASIEISSINQIASIIGEKLRCCNGNRLRMSEANCSGCMFTPNELKLRLMEMGFVEFNIGIEPQYLVGQDLCNPVNRTRGNRIGSTPIINHVSYPITIDNQSINLSDYIGGILSPGGSSNLKIYIVDLWSLVDNQCFKYIDEMKENNGGVMYFIYNFPNETKLFISPTFIELKALTDPEYLSELAIDEQQSLDCEGCPDWMFEIWNPYYDPENGNTLLGAIAPALPISQVDGPVIPIGDILAAIAALVLAEDWASKWVYVTYTVYHPPTNQYYAGRSSGWNRDPASILATRFHNHPYSLFAPTLDQSAITYPWGYWAIRGREQQLIDYYGGALSAAPDRPVSDCNSGIVQCANKIRGVRKANPMGHLYHYLSTYLFGEKCGFTGYGFLDIEEIIRKYWTIKW